MCRHRRRTKALTKSVIKIYCHSPTTRLPAPQHERRFIMVRRDGAPVADRSGGCGMLFGERRRAARSDVRLPKLLKSGIGLVHLTYHPQLPNRSVAAPFGDSCTRHRRRCHFGQILLRCGQSIATRFLPPPSGQIRSRSPARRHSRGLLRLSR